MGHLSATPQPRRNPGDYVGVRLPANLPINLDFNLFKRGVVHKSLFQPWARLVQSRQLLRSIELEKSLLPEISETLAYDGDIWYD